MKRLFSLLLLGLAAVAFKLPGISIGDELPVANTAVKDVSGKTMALKDAMADNGMVVMFSCNTCPYVIKNQERTKKILAYAQAKQVGVMVLNSNEGNRPGKDGLDAMKKYASEQSYKWTYAVDKDHVIADAFGANRTPECFLFDKNSKLVYHGAIDNSPADESAVTQTYLKRAIDEMIAGKPISIQSSRSLGCSIKRTK